MAYLTLLLLPPTEIDQKRIYFIDDNQKYGNEHFSPLLQQTKKNQKLTDM